MSTFAEQVLGSKSKKVCVIAAPGSGKTTSILVPKVQQLLSDLRVDAKNIALLSFSRLSAQDLRKRTHALDPALTATTVHSLCLSFLLSENHHDMRKRVNSIVLDFERAALIADLKVIFPRRHKNDLKDNLKQFSAAWAIQPHDQVFEENAERQAFKAAVVNWLDEHEAAMMEEIVYGAVNLAKKLGLEGVRQFKYVLVDEYQDLNRLEQEFIALVGNKAELILHVGDPDQSIYSFKYAYPDGILAWAKQPDVDPHYNNTTLRCPKRVVEVANQLLVQAEPGRTQLLKPRDGAADGEATFVRKNSQDEEFDHVATSIAKRIATGVEPKDILVLTPKKPLGAMFVSYANAARQRLGIPETVRVDLALRPDFNQLSQEHLLLMGLVVNPKSLVHLRAFLGLGDDEWYAAELHALKEKHGSLMTLVGSADLADTGRKRMRALRSRILALRETLTELAQLNDLTTVIDRLFPDGEAEVAELRTLLLSLREEDDDTEKLYDKLVDYMRSVPVSGKTVRVMTLMASKGLDAPHVYVMGCSDGNIPGTNRSVHLTDQQYRAEQRRLLYVGFTRAKESLTVTWSRNIPYAQARRHHTRGIRVRSGQGGRVNVLSLSQFLNDLNVPWSN